MKRQSRRTIFLGAYLAGAVCLVWGCSGIPVLKGGVPGTGDHYGATRTTANTGSLSVRVSLPSKLKVQNVDDQIDHIVVTVAPNTASDWTTPALTFTVTKKMLATGIAYATFHSVPIGGPTTGDETNTHGVDVSAVAYDVADAILASTNSNPLEKSSADNVRVSAGVLTTVPLFLTWDSGGLNAVVKLWIGSPENLTAGFEDPTTLQNGALLVGGASRLEDNTAVGNGTYGLQNGLYPSNYLSASEYSCGTCHEREQEVYHGSLHNQWVPSKFTGTSCRSCHTVGADPNTGSTRTVNGQRYGSDFSQAITAYPNPAYMGVQCEACHGGGSNHVTTPTISDKLNSITRYPDWKQTCLRCHQDGFNKVQRMQNAKDSAWNFTAGNGNVWPSYPTYLVSNEDINKGGGGGIILRHGKQSLMLLGGGGYLFASDGGATDSFVPTLSATNSSMPGWATTYLNPYNDVTNPHRDSVANGCITCHMNPADPEAHNPNIGETVARLDAVATMVCAQCHGTTFTGNSIRNYKSATQLQIDTLRDLLIAFRRKHAMELMTASHTEFTPAKTRLATDSTTIATYSAEIVGSGSIAVTGGTAWAVDIASLSVPVAAWDDSPSTVFDSGNANQTNGTIYTSQSVPNNWSPRMTAYNGAFWNYVFLNGLMTYSKSGSTITPSITGGEGAGGIHNPPYAQRLLRQSIDTLRAKM